MWVVSNINFFSFVINPFIKSNVSALEITKCIRGRGLAVMGAKLRNSSSVGLHLWNLQTPYN